MGAHGYTLFETSIGRCGIAWGARGITALQLPERTERETAARLLRRAGSAPPAAPPPEVQRTIDAIAALMRGEPIDLGSVPLDLEGVPPFHRRAYEVARTIAPGETRSYGEIAAALGSPRAARAVGQAMGRNPFPIVVPCHRVLAAGGKSGGFSATGGVGTKLRMLAIERGAAEAGSTAPCIDGARAVAHLRAADPRLAPLIDAVGTFAMSVDRTSTLFFALAEAITYQQLTGKAAATIFGRVRALVDDFTPAAVLRISDEALRGAGLSRAKALALYDLARRTEAGELLTREQAQAMDDAEIVDRLTTVRGVGPWTAQMFLMFRLGRPDVLPADDLGIRTGLARTLRRRALPTPAALARRGERWRPYRTVASWYLWRALELPRDPA